MGYLLAGKVRRILKRFREWGKISAGEEDVFTRKVMSPQVVGRQGGRR